MASARNLPGKAAQDGTGGPARRVPGRVFRTNAPQPQFTLDSGLLDGNLDARRVIRWHGDYDDWGFRIGVEPVADFRGHGTPLLIE